VSVLLRVYEIVIDLGLSGFRDDADEICARLGYHATSPGSWLPTFRDNVSVLYARVKSVETLDP
jgi:hypothetical protein